MSPSSTCYWRTWRELTGSQEIYRVPLVIAALPPPHPGFDIRPLEKYHILVLNIFPIPTEAAADITDISGRAPGDLISRRFDSAFGAS